MKKALIASCIVLCLQSNAQTFYSLEEAKLMAKATNKLILLDFTATWCGPCRKMDMEFWGNEAYQQNLSKFIIAKIDIDQNRSLANDYNVRGIPNIKVLDITGEELMGFVGYAGADMIEKELAGFPASVGDLYETMEFENKGKPNAEECLYAASSYQGIAQTASGTPKDVLLRQSNNYFTKCKKNHPTDSIAQKADIGRAFNYVLDNSPQKAIKQIDIEKTHTENKPFALYILARAYGDMKDKANAEKYLALLETTNEAEWKTAIAAIRKGLEKN